MVRVTVESNYVGDPPVSTLIEYDVETVSDAPSGAIAELVSLVDRIAEIPDPLRAGTQVQLRSHKS